MSQWPWKPISEAPEREELWTKIDDAPCGNGPGRGTAEDRMKQSVALKVFDAISHNGVYERDLLHKLVGTLSQHSIEEALAWLSERRYIKRAGDKARPIYVRMESAKTVYTNIRPGSAKETDIMLQMHSNFEEKPR